MFVLYFSGNITAMKRKPETIRPSPETRKQQLPTKVITAELLSVTSTEYIHPRVIQYSGGALIKERKFVKMGFGTIYIFGVVSGNTSEEKVWDIFKVYGSLEDKKYRKSNMSCCFLYRIQNQTYVKRVDHIVKQFFQVAAPISTFYMACPNVLHSYKIVPIGVAITVENGSCSGDNVTYVQPYFPLKHPNKIAIGTKTSFANISAELIVEWMEAYKYLGVDKVVTYYISSINADALKVLRYYASTGLLDLSYYEPAAEGNHLFIVMASSLYTLGFQ